MPSWRWAEVHQALLDAAGGDPWLVEDLEPYLYDMDYVNPTDVRERAVPSGGASSQRRRRKLVSCNNDGLLMAHGVAQEVARRLGPGPSSHLWDPELRETGEMHCTGGGGGTAGRGDDCPVTRA